jgi:hypothetical protein
MPALLEIRELVRQKTGVDTVAPDLAHHAKEIISLCVTLHTDLTAQKVDLDDTWNKTSTACASKATSFDEIITGNEDGIQTNSEVVVEDEQSISTKKSTVIQEKGGLVTSKRLLKELEISCEEAAKDWEEHTEQRTSELAAIKKALALLSGAPAESADVALIEHSPRKAATFLQLRSVHQRVDPQQLKRKVLSSLQNTGRRLDSITLLAFVARVQASPFDKVRKLIQDLQQRLRDEAQADQKQKSYCDTALAKAGNDVDRYTSETTDTTADIRDSEAKRDELEESIRLLANGLAENADSVAEATSTRSAEKASNAQILKDATTGLTAVKDAIKSLKQYYATAFLQARTVASSNPYQSQSDGMTAVFGLLEVIASDFDHTVRATKVAEEAAAREFYKLSTALKVDTKSKETTKTMDIQYLKETNATIKEQNGTLTSKTELLELAKQEHEALKTTTCNNAGMSYEEKKEKRDAEIAGLQQALCMLEADSAAAMSACGTMDSTSFI